MATDSKRRKILAGAAIGGVAVGIGALPFVIDGRTEHVTPAEARHRGATLSSLTVEEATLLEQFGEMLLPGAAEAGVAQFVDQQLSIPHNDAKLLVRYLEIPPPFLPFYRESIAALERFVADRWGGGLADLGEAERGQLVGAMLGNDADWAGPPPMIFYLSLRSDAVDVVYGTKDGVEGLGVPYMAHIEPATPW